MPLTLNDVNRATVLRLLQRHRPEPGRACLPPGCSCGHAGDHDEHLAALIVEAVAGPSMPEPVVVGSVTYVTRGDGRQGGVLYLDDDGTVRSKPARDPR